MRVCIFASFLLSVSSASAGYLPKLALGNQGVNTGTIVGNSWSSLGETVFAGTTTKVFAKSNTTTSQVGRPNVFEIGWSNGGQNADNTFYTDSLGCGVIDAIALAGKDVDGDGESTVYIDFRFIDAAVENLKLVIFDVDEMHNGIREKVIINAYDDIRARRVDKIDPGNWDILGMGDMSLANNPLEVTLPPNWYTVNSGTENSFGLLQTRKRQNQNRDYTVLRMPDAITRLQIRFSAARGASTNEIG